MYGAFQSSSRKGKAWDIHHVLVYYFLYNINACTLIGQSAVGYCAGKPT